MDPFSQGFLGGWAAQKITKNKEQIAKATFCGFIGGILPDADILIRSHEDTLLTIQYHRHFTHSLIFIPFGGLIAALMCYFALMRKMDFKLVYLFCTIGFATHGLLDGMTSYGTHLSWPFSEYRTSWSIISVVDPLFTIPLALAVILTWKKKQKRYIHWATAYMICYLSIGVFQNHKVTNLLESLADHRGHKIEHYEVKPTIANNILWRTVYRYNKRIYTDAIRVSWFGSKKHYEGTSMTALEFPSDFEGLGSEGQLYYDLKRFFHFSNNLVGYEDKKSTILVDARYSNEPQGVSPMWGLIYDINSPENRAKFRSFSRTINNERQAKFTKMLFGESL